MIEKYLWIAGSIPFIILGGIHLLYTFFTNKFSCRSKLVDEQMKTSFPILTKETTMWKAWTGFNASHSSGAIYIGVMNLLLAIGHFDVVKNPVVLLLNVGTAMFYVWLGKKYWFRIPFIGMMLTACCFIVSAIMIMI